jgi:hypothetical protein
MYSWNRPLLSEVVQEARLDAGGEDGVQRRHQLERVLQPDHVVQLVLDLRQRFLTEENFSFHIFPPENLRPVLATKLVVQIIKHFL